jgi:hypothetical protein
VEDIIKVIDASTQELCTPSVIRFQTHTLQQVSRTPTGGVVAMLMTYVTRYDSCIAQATDETIEDLFEMASNILDCPLQNVLDEFRDFVDFLKYLWTNSKTCGESLNDILTDNIKYSALIDFAETLFQSDLQFALDNSTQSSFLVPKKTFASRDVPECIVADFTVYEVDPYAVPNQR